MIEKDSVKFDRYYYIDESRTLTLFFDYNNSPRIMTVKIMDDHLKILDNKLSKEENEQILSILIESNEELKEKLTSEIYRHGDIKVLLKQSLKGTFKRNG